MTVTKVELIEAIYETGISRAEAERAIDAVIDTLKAALCRGERIELRKFGNFTPKLTPPRMGRNPKTGEPHEIVPRARLNFKVAKSLSNAVTEAMQRR